MLTVCAVCRVHADELDMLLPAALLVPNDDVAPRPTFLFGTII